MDPTVSERTLTSVAKYLEHRAAKIEATLPGGEPMANGVAQQRMHELRMAAANIRNEVARDKVKRS